VSGASRDEAVKRLSSPWTLRANAEGVGFGIVDAILVLRIPLQGTFQFHGNAAGEEGGAEAVQLLKTYLRTRNSGKRTAPVNP
jgi:hypothetical protein